MYYNDSRIEERFKMNINTNYQLRFNSQLKNSQLRATPNFGNTQKFVTESAKNIVPTITAIPAVIVLATLSGKNKATTQEYSTKDYGKLVYTKGSNGEKSSLDVTRINGTVVKLFEEIPKEVLESPVMEHVHQANSSTINKNGGIILIQNKSDKSVMARKIPLKGTLEENMLNSNIHNIPLKFDMGKDSQKINAPWSDQFITQKCFMVIYGTVDENSYALDSYLNEYTNPATGKAPDVAVLAAEKGAEDRSIVPANIALGQYEVVLENGERIPCDYENMEVGKVYMIAKKEAILKMAVPPTEVISSEGEVLPANKLYMIDSMGHFYNGQPIKRIKSGEVTWNADMNDPVQAQIRMHIDEAIKLEAEAKAAKNAGNKELSSDLSKQAKQLTSKAEQEMTEWVKSAQNTNNLDFFE